VRWAPTRSDALRTVSAPTDPLATLHLELETLARAYSPGHHGVWAARRRSELVDECLVRLWERAGPPLRCALVAIGGYGRRLQLPASDVDVLLLHDGTSPEDVRRLTDAILYPLWDAGLAVGQAVRTPEECVEMARDRFDALTAMLDGRVLAGDGDVASRALAAVREPVTADPKGFAARLRRAASERRERFGSVAQLLEPDLKEGSGGLRDVASIGWLEIALGADLVRAGLLRSHERDSLDAAEEFLVRARSAIHLETEKRTDRLIADLQPAVAHAMGFVDEPRLIAIDGLMRALFQHARDVEHVLGVVVDRAAVDGGKVVPDGATAGAESPTTDPSAVLVLLADLADVDGVASAELLDAIENASVPDPVVWTDGAREAFLRLLRAGGPGIRMLDALDRLDLLARYLPPWRAVRCRPQRDPYHRFTVDAHLTEALEGMARLLRLGDHDDPIHDELAPLLTDHDALLLGALLHDIGKVGEGNHVPIGTRAAAELLDSMGVAADTRDLGVFMVAEHLLLPDTATRRDLTDENLVLDVAARVGTPDRLAALYLLAKADAVATGPAAWTPWRRTLIRELVAKVQHVLERGEMGERLASRLTDRVERVRELLDAEPGADVDRFVLRMPRGYFLAVEPSQAARHFRTIAPVLGANEVRTATASGVRARTYEVLVVAVDRPGLLSWISGALAIGGISILSAQVFTTEDGTAVDLFEVEGAFEPEITESRWRAFRSTLRRTIEGSISLEHRVDEKRRSYPAPKAPTPVTVQADNHASDFFTVVEVGAPDRIGLLYDITRVFADLKLDVHLAKVATYGGRVVDAFYVRDGVGRKIEDPVHLGEIESALRAQLRPAS
jgi:[protein-PII] uridylyltransferase